MKEEVYSTVYTGSPAHRKQSIKFVDKIIIVQEKVKEYRLNFD